MDKRRITIYIEEDTARSLLDSKQDYEDREGITLSLSSYVAMLIRKSHGKNA